MRSALATRGTTWTVWNSSEATLCPSHRLWDTRRDPCGDPHSLWLPVHSCTSSSILRPTRRVSFILVPSRRPVLLSPRFYFSTRRLIGLLQTRPLPSRSHRSCSSDSNSLFAFTSNPFFSHLVQYCLVRSLVLSFCGHLSSDSAHHDSVGASGLGDAYESCAFALFPKNHIGAPSIVSTHLSFVSLNPVGAKRSRQG